MNKELSKQKVVDPVLNGWNKFQELVLTESTRIIIPLVNEHRSEMGKNLWNHLFDTGDLTPISRNISRDEQYFNKIFNGYSEISSSIHTLEDIEVYINSFPYRNKRITKLRNLSYHIENYFSELYILKERLKVYLKQIGRSFKNDEKHKTISSITTSFLTIVDHVFLETTKERGRHIHVARFQDNEIKRLESLELLKLVNDGELKRMISPYLKFDYLLLRKKWKQKIKTMNRSFQQFIDVYGDLLIAHLFDEKKHLIYPNTPKD